jgi:hypothetical protein
MGLPTNVRVRSISTERSLPSRRVECLPGLAVHELAAELSSRAIHDSTTAI